MRNIVIALSGIEIALSSTLSLSVREQKEFKHSMLRVAKAFAPFFKRQWKNSSITCTIELCGKSKIRSLNKHYRQKDKTTDVLSFQLHDRIRELKNLPMPVTHLGDVFICREIAKRQAQQFNISEKEEWIHLAVHGILHLCGYDHEISAAEEKLMEKLEKEILKNIAKIKQ